MYLCAGNPELPEYHPQTILLKRTNGFITADLFEPESYSYRLYYCEPLKQFLAECLNKEDLFFYDDPISNMIINVVKQGEKFNWHFDTNEVTITMLLQAADSGGIFEYVPCLRKPDDESFVEVSIELKSDRSRLKKLGLKAGDLQFFRKILIA